MAPRKKKGQDVSSGNLSHDTNTSRTTIVVSVIGLIGTLGVAIIGYLNSRSQIVLPISATQTAEARLIAAPTLTPSNNPTLSLTDLNKPVKPDGEIIHHLDGGLQTVGAGVSVSDFMAEVDFVVPFSNHPWTNVITFRGTSRIWANNTANNSGEGGYGYFDAAGEWHENSFQLPDGLLKVQEGEVNKLQFIASGNIGCIYVNGENVAQANIVNSDVLSDVGIGISEREYKIENAITRYDNFSIYTLNEPINSCPSSTS